MSPSRPPRSTPIPHDGPAMTESARSQSARSQSTRRSRVARSGLLLGEWACLGVLLDNPAHGFSIAAQLRPDTTVGRVWSLSRPLTYRSLDQLADRGLVRPIGSEPGHAGPNRTILAVTPRGRTQLLEWLAMPVEHLRDLRAELLLKLVLADRCSVDIADMLEAQRVRIESQAAALAGVAFDVDGSVRDVVALWRFEASQAGLRFLEQVAR
jgi:DNA-binding PadR family transcriptional regulator